MRLPAISLPIRSTRLVLRRIASTDAALRFALHRDPAYVEFIGRPIDRTRSDTELTRELDGDVDYFNAVITVGVDERMIGECVILTTTDHEVELVIALLPAYQRMGYGQEAAHEMIRACFEDGYISTVIARVEAENTASMQLVRSLGMTQEGVMPQADGKMPLRFVVRR